MERQARQLAELMPRDAEFSDLTLGGGTPLLLPEHLLGKVFSIARDYFGIEPGKSAVTVETSPNQTTGEKLKILKEEGVTRLSIGQAAGPAAPWLIHTLPSAAVFALPGKINCSTRIYTDKKEYENTGCFPRLTACRHNPSIPGPEGPDMPFYGDNCTYTGYMDVPSEYPPTTENAYTEL